MPQSLTVKLPNGDTHTYDNVPDNVTQEQAQARAAREFSSGTLAQPKMGVGSMLVGSVLNAPSSALEFGKNLVQPILHPMDNAESFIKLFLSAANKVGLGTADPTLANEVGKYFVDRYGSVDNAMRTFSKDPFGMASDFAAVVKGGGKLVGKVPKMGAVAGAMARTGAAVDPLNVAAKTATGLKMLGTGATGLTSGTGYRAVEEAGKAGYAGGKAGEAFYSEMSKTADPSAVVQEAKAAVDNLRKQRQSQYLSGMSGVTQDKTVLDFKPIFDAFGQLQNAGQFYGKSINKPATAAVEKIGKIIKDWGASDPTIFHTPEGLDKLKQAIRNEAKGYEPNSPQRAVADKMYSEVRQIVANQAPDYMKVMGDYEQASDLLDEMERSLSLTDRATLDTTTRKLDSILRDSANTNYGQRAALGEKLTESGAETLFPRLAGRSMSAMLPRGMSGTLYGTGQLANALHGVSQAGINQLLNPVAGLSLAASSPRIVGETMYRAGQVAGLPKRFAELLSNYGDKLSAKNPAMAFTVDRAKRAIAAGQKIDPTYAQQLALQLSRIAEADKSEDRQ